MAPPGRTPDGADARRDARPGRSPTRDRRGPGRPDAGPARPGTGKLADPERPHSPLARAGPGDAHGPIGLDRLGRTAGRRPADRPAPGERPRGAEARPDPHLAVQQLHPQRVELAAEPRRSMPLPTSEANSEGVSTTESARQPLSESTFAVGRRQRARARPPCRRGGGRTPDGRGRSPAVPRAPPDPGRATRAPARPPARGTEHLERCGETAHHAASSSVSRGS